MGDVIASGQINVDIDAGAVEAGLRRVEADFKRSMDAIGRQKAEAEIGVKTTDVDSKIADVKRKLTDLDAQQSEPNVKLDDDEAKAEIKLLKAELKELQQQKTDIRVDSSQLRDANKEAAISAKRQSEMAKQYDRVRAAQEKATTATKKNSEAGLKAASDVNRLRESYAKLRGEASQLEKKTGRPGGIFRTDAETRGLDRVRSDLALTAHRIEALGGTVDDIDPALEKHQGILGSWANSLSHLRIQAGFFSATLRQFAVGFIGLGPILTSLLGAATSIIGVFGTGLAGAFSVGTAAAGGFALSALGIGLVLKPVIGDIKVATAASKAYNEAVLKYGKNSEQAKTANEKLNMTLKGIDPAARQAIKDFGSVSSEWKKLTKPAKAPIFDAIAGSFKTVQALMPKFAKETVATTKVASKAWQGWMTSLRSSEAKQLLGDVMSNFRASIPGVASGLASIGGSLARISASASKFLPGLSHGFAGWAANIEKSVGSGASLDASIGRLIGHMRDIGHLAQSSGSLLVHLFDTSANSGDNLVESLTKVTNKWDAWVQSVHGQSSLKSFFSDSAGETKELFSVLGGVVKIMFQIGRAAAPISTGFLKVLTILGNVVTAISEFGPLKTVLEGVGAVLAGMWAVGKVKAFAGAVQDVIAAVRTLAASQTLSGLSGGLFGGAGAAGGAGGGLVAEREASRAGVAFEGATADAGLFAAALAPEVLIPAGAIAGLALLIGNTGEAETAFTRATKAFREGSKEMPNAIKAVVNAGAHYNESLHEQASATDKVSEASKRSAKLMREGAPIAKQIKAVQELAAAEKEQAKIATQLGAGRLQSVTSAKSALAVAETRKKAAETSLKATKEEQKGVLNNKGEIASRSELNPAILHKEAVAQHELAEAAAETAEAYRAVVVSEIPLERQNKGLNAITEQTQQGLQKLSDTIGAAATKKIGNFVNPQDVARVTNLSNKLTSLGRGSQVKNIDVKSKGADETSAKLQKLQRQTARVEGTRATVKVSANDTGAQASLKKVSALSQRVAGTKATVHILANADNAEQAIQRLSQHLKAVAQAKYQARITAIDQASPPGSQARAHLTAVAQGHYQARITAIDNASAPAKRAKANADSVKGNYAAHISAPGAAQAAAQIQTVTNALAAMPSSKTVTVHYSSTGSTAPGHAEGGPSTYGPTVEEPRGRSRVVRRPTMITGEEGGSHPEYVIATNPAYRDNNERYLGSAARDLGYELIPAYKKGGLSNKRAVSAAPSAGASASAAKGPGAKPPAAHGRHHYLPSSALVFDKRFNRYEHEAEAEEGNYNAELRREEEEISAGRLQKWNYDKLRGMKTNIRNDFKSITETIMPHIREQVNKQKSEATKAVTDIHHRLPQVDGKLGALENDYSKMKKGKNEKDSDYTKRKNAKKHEVEVMKREKKKLTEERKAAENIIQEAKKEINELNQTLEPNAKTSLAEAGNDIQYLNDVESGAIEQPYENSAEKAKKLAEEKATTAASTPTPGEETASINQARYELYKSFASNVTGPTSYTPLAATVGAVAHGLGVKFAGAGIGATGVAALPHRGGGQGALAVAGEPAATVNNVTNNFAAPPPDPHTWTKQQQFELGALA